MALALASTAAVVLLNTPAAAQSTVALAAPDISLTNMQGHLSQLQTIANNNGGTRRSTTAGYTASVTYVYDKLVAAGYSVVKQPCTSGCTVGAGPNIIADWPGGDTTQVVMMGAHLDSVTAGPGLNDNGSGSSMLLEVALTLAAQKPSMAKHVRFGWWTDEEQGLNGSEFYVNSLPSTEKTKIKNYLNFDMVASPNAGYFINRITSATGQVVKAYYDSIGIQTEENTEGAGRSDDASFNAASIQTSGIAAGASALKTSAQATKWGGTAGAAYDACYHRSCDTYPSNVNTTVLNRAGDAAAYALWNLAVSTGGVTVTNPGSKTGTVGTATSQQMTASGGTSPYTWTATGLPAGLAINASTGLISGTPTTAGTYNSTVTAKDTAAATGSASFSWTISPTGGGCASPGQKLGNPGFETGTAAPWSATAGVIDSSTGQPAHSGSWKAWLNGYGTTHTDTLTQSVSIPAGCSTYTLSFWLHIDTAETTTTTAYDTLTVKAGTTTLATYSNLNKNTGYAQKSFNVSSLAGQTITISFSGTEDSSLQTSFVIDDTALNVS